MVPLRVGLPPLLPVILSLRAADYTEGSALDVLGHVSRTLLSGSGGIAVPGTAGLGVAMWHFQVERESAMQAR